MDFEVGKYFGEIQKLVITHCISILFAILLLFVGLRTIKVIVNTLNKKMEKRGVDEFLRPFLISLLSILFKVMLFISVIQIIGIETTSFVAFLATAGLALGQAKKSFDLENIPIPFPQMDVHVFKQN